MPITYGPGASDAVRTRLPGDANTIVAGQAARDADDRFGALPTFQRVDVVNQLYTEPMFVTMASKPAIVLVGVSLAFDPQGATINMGCVAEFTWLGDGISVRHIDGMSAVISPNTRYNFAFLGVG